MNPDMATWKQVTLGQVGNWGSGGTPKSTEKSYYDGVIPWIRSGDLPDGPITEHFASLTDAGLQYSSAKWVPKDSVLIALYGATIGKLGINTYPVTTNQAVAYCAPNKSLTTPEFLFWFLLHIRPELIALGQGGAQPNISQTILKSYSLPLPPLDEQRRIVARLDALLARSKRARAELAHVPGLVERQRQAVLANLFSQAEAPWIEMGDVISNGPQNGLYLPKSAYGTGFPILRIENYDFEKAQPISEWKRVQTSEEDAQKYGLHAGDIVVNRVNSPSHLGKSLLITSAEVPSIFESNMMRFTITNEVMPEFIYYYLSSDFGRQKLIKDAKWAVNQASINQGDVCSTLVPLPSLEQQAEIIRKIQAMRQKLASVSQQRATAAALLDRLDQATLARAFRGEL